MSLVKFETDGIYSCELHVAKIKLKKHETE
jgi:hypothetical protein